MQAGSIPDDLVIRSDAPTSKIYLNAGGDNAKVGICLSENNWVGIGRVPTKVKLEVAGNVYVQGPAGDSGGSMVSLAQNGATIAGYGGGSYPVYGMGSAVGGKVSFSGYYGMYFFTKDSTDTGKPTMYISGAADGMYGNVGINTTAPKKPLHVIGEVCSEAANSFRIVRGDYGAFMRNDGGACYLMQTNKGDPYGGFSNNRPLEYNFETGNVGLGNMTLYVTDPGNANNTQGRVGIGLPQTAGVPDVPECRLHVNGDVRATALVAKGIFPGPQFRAGTESQHFFSGTYVTWNQDAGAGESVYINEKGIGHGGHVWAEGQRDSLNYTKRMYLTSAGKLGIGSTWNPYPGPSAFLPQAELHVIGNILASGSIVPSDERLKEDIVLADVDTCYDNVKALPLKYYKWRDDVFDEMKLEDKHKLGWIAQEVEEIFPSSVSKKQMNGYDDCRVFNPDQIYASMYGAMQKVIAISEGHTQAIAAHTQTIADLMQRNDVLLRQNIDLHARLAALEQQPQGAAPDPVDVQEPAPDPPQT